jgi:hypothetical protein
VAPSVRAAFGAVLRPIPHRVLLGSPGAGSRRSRRCTGADTRQMSHRRFRGVAQSIGHHAQSGVSFIHPHLWHACQQAGTREAAVELLTDPLYPVGLPHSEALAKSLPRVREKLFATIAKHGLSHRELASARLQFTFAEDGLCEVRAVLRTRVGRTYEKTVPMVAPSQPAPVRREKPRGGVPNWVRDLLERLWPT